MWNRLNQVRRLLRVSIWRTLFFNFYMLPFRKAIKIPFIIGRNTYFYDLSGTILIEGNITTGLIRFGFFGEDTQMWNNDKTLLYIKGKVLFKGSARFGVGLTIRVEKEGVLDIGKDVMVSNNSKIICYEKISIGEHSRIAWETQIIDTSFHFIKDVNTGTISQLNSKIIIGKNNWIGNRSSIMKGAVTPNYCIVASGSLVNKPLTFPANCIVAGTPVKLIKENVYRVLMAEEAEIKKNLNLNK